MAPIRPEIPATMRALEIRAYDGRPESLAIVTRPVPAPGPGQILVRIRAAPINPSDLMFLRGLYGFRKELPAIPGFEGSGTVVAAGKGMMARALLGRGVACAAADASIAWGTWAEYLVTSAKFAVPLARSVNLEQAAMLLVNPITAWALMEIARSEGHRAVIQTAAASALGRMIVRLGRRFSLPVINVVRRREQADELAALGAGHTLISTDDHFDRELRLAARRLDATLGFEAVAGDLTRRVLDALPTQARVLVYGALSLEPCQVNPASLIFEGKRVEGFWLSTWLAGKSLPARYRLSRQVQSLLTDDLQTQVQARLPLESGAEAVERYSHNMSAGKVLLVPGLGVGSRAATANH
ncbi:MAG TPA: zinc-binding dehydrogenase [Terriglobia bacterium]|nr:zinc-binding dehydrogenase [Terriglobia bacterium]